MMRPHEGLCGGGGSRDAVVSMVGTDSQSNQELLRKWATTSPLCAFFIELTLQLS